MGRDAGGRAASWRARVRKNPKVRHQEPKSINALPCDQTSRTPRIPFVAASMAMTKSVMGIADVVAVIGSAAAGRLGTSVGASECKSIGGKRGNAESKGDCNNNHYFMHPDPLFFLRLKSMKGLANRLTTIAAVGARLRHFRFGGTIYPSSLNHPWIEHGSRGPAMGAAHAAGSAHSLDALLLAREMAFTDPHMPAIRTDKPLRPLGAAVSCEAAVICGRRQPGRPAKRRGERACLAEAQRQSDIGHRWRRLGQQHLGVLDAALVVIAMRRHAEGLLERPAKVDTG